MIAKAAKDLIEYAKRVEKEVPSLRDSLNGGLTAMSEVISLRTELAQDQAQLEQVSTWITSMRSLRQIWAFAQEKTESFHATVVNLPPTTGELIKAKRVVATTLRNLIDVLHSQQMVLIQIEDAAALLLQTD